MKLQFTELAWTKIDALVQENKDEVGWWGVTCLVPAIEEVKYTTNTPYVKAEEAYLSVIDIYVPIQVVSSADWDADKDSMADMPLDYPEIVDYLIDPAYKLNYMGHSHVNMGVNPSPQDYSYIDSLLEKENDDEHRFYTSIHNKSGDVSGLVSVKVNGIGRMSNDLDVEYIPRDETPEEIWAKDITKQNVSRFVKKPTYAYPANTHTKYRPTTFDGTPYGHQQVLLPGATDEQKQIAQDEWDELWQEELLRWA